MEDDETSHEDGERSEDLFEVEASSLEQLENPIHYVTSPASSSSGHALQLDLGSCNLDRLHHWVLGFAVLSFDLDLGQIIEHTFPSDLGVYLSDREKSDIRFSSFPDANSFVGDTVFSFCTVASTWTLSQFVNISHAKRLFGYVFFRQKRDPSLRRGYLQKSVVLLSPFPWPGLFLRMVGILGPMYLEYLTPSTPVGITSEMHSNTNTESLSLRMNEAKKLLETVARQIAKWPAPALGMHCALPFFGLIFRVELPNYASVTAIGGQAQLVETSAFKLVCTTVSETSSLAALTRRISNAVSFFAAANVSLTEEQLAINEEILASLPVSILFPSGFFALFPPGSRSSLSQIETSLPSPYIQPDFLKHSNFGDLPGTSLGMFYRFGGLLDHLWLLWESVLFGESIAVIGSTQCAVSETVWWLAHLISPLEFCGELHPYMTIQNAAYSYISNLMKKDQGSKQSSSGRNSPFALFSKRPSTPTKAGRYLTLNQALETSIVSLLAKSLSNNQRVPGFANFDLSSESFSNSHDRNAIIMGATNVFFIEALKQWPNVLTISSKPFRGVIHSVDRKNEQRKNEHSGTSSAGSLSRPQTPQQPENNSVAPPTISASVSYSPQFKNTQKPKSKSTNIKLKPGYRSSHSSFLHRDRKLIYGLLDAYNIGVLPQPFSIPNSRSSNHSESSNCKIPGYTFSELIRMHFVSLTDKFMAPFNRYFISLIPVNVLPSLSDTRHNPNVRPFMFGKDTNTRNGKVLFLSLQAPPQFSIKPFEIHTFLSQLISSNARPDLPFKSSLTPLTSRKYKNGWIDMYIRFLDSLHFLGWLKRQKQKAESTLRHSFLNSLSSISFPEIDPDDSLLLDVFLQIRAVLTHTGYAYPWSIETNKFTLFPPPENQEMTNTLETLAHKIWTVLSSDIQTCIKRGEMEYKGSNESPMVDDDVILVV